MVLLYQKMFSCCCYKFVYSGFFFVSFISMCLNYGAYRKTSICLSFCSFFFTTSGFMDFEKKLKKDFPSTTLNILLLASFFLIFQFFPP